MSGKRRNLSRREWLAAAMALGLTGGAAILWAASSQNKRVLEQVLGPFFPDPGDPVDPIRELNTDIEPIPLANDWDLTQIQGKPGRAAGQVLNLSGRVLAPDGKPQSASRILLWQASSSGRYNHRYDGGNLRFKDPRGRVLEREHDPHFQYWGHAVTDADGRYRFKTIIPGYYPADFERGWFRPPHLHFLVQSEGFPELVTQTYFRGRSVPDDDYIQNLNARDFILRDPKLSSQEQERLIVEYLPDPKFPEELSGHFDFLLRTE